MTLSIPCAACGAMLPIPLITSPVPGGAVVRVTRGVWLVFCGGCVELAPVSDMRPATTAKERRRR